MAQPVPPDNPGAMVSWLRRTADTIDTNQGGVFACGALRVAATMIEQGQADALELAQAKATIAQLTARRGEQDAELGATRRQLVDAQGRASQADARSVADAARQTAVS